MSDDQNQRFLNRNYTKNVNTRIGNRNKENSEKSYTPPRRTRHISPIMFDRSPSERRQQSELDQTISKLCECIEVQKTVSKDMLAASTTLSNALKEMTTLFQTNRSEQEAERRSNSDVRRSETRVNMADARVVAAKPKCFRCNKAGHLARNCPLIEYHAWYCFYCQAVREHKGDDCPNRGNPKDGFVKKQPGLQDRRDFRGRGRGKGSIRVRQGRVNKPVGGKEYVSKRGRRGANPRAFYSDGSRHHLDKSARNPSDVKRNSDGRSEAQ